MAVTLEAGRRRVRGLPARPEHDTNDARSASDDPVPAPAASDTIDLPFEEAFEELYVRAYGVAYQLLGRRSESEDVAQETLARAYVRWRRIRGYAEAWVVRVAGNLAIDAWRRQRKVGTDFGATKGATSPGPDEQRVDLHRALGALSRRQREVLVLRFLADLPEADVAAVLGCSVGSVKQHGSRGLAALRTTMGVDDAVEYEEQS